MYGKNPINARPSPPYHHEEHVKWCSHQDVWMSQKRAPHLEPSLYEPKERVAYKQQLSFWQSSLDQESKQCHVMPHFPYKCCRQYVQPIKPSPGIIRYLPGVYGASSSHTKGDVYYRTTPAMHLTLGLWDWPWALLFGPPIVITNDLTQRKVAGVRQPLYIRHSVCSSGQVFSKYFYRKIKKPKLHQESSRQL